MSGQLQAPAALSLYPLDRELGWTPEPCGCGGEEKRKDILAGNRTPVVQPLANHTLIELPPKCVVCATAALTPKACHVNVSI